MIMRTFRINKLIRDKRIKEMKDYNIDANYITLPKDSVINLLKQRIYDDAKSLKNYKTREEIIDGIDDILEAVDGLMEAMDISKEMVKKIKSEKQKKFGRFKKGIFLINVNVRKEDKKIIDFFENHSKMYPEIKEYMERAN